MTATQRLNTINALETALDFFSNVVSVINPITQTFSITTCSSYSFSASQKTKSKFLDILQMILFYFLNRMVEG
jgi:hypothetical protein